MLVLLLLLAGQGVPAPHTTDLNTAWNILRQGITENGPDGRASAIHALGLVPDDPVIQQMAEHALEDQNADVRTEAATALGKMHAVSARAKLREALNDKELKVVLAATSALYVLKDPIAYQVYYAIVTGQRKSSSGLVQTQLDRLHDRKQMEKLAFETGIGFVPFGSMAFEIWQTITRDDSSAVEVEAIERLASDPDPKSEKAIEEACYQSKWQVRGAAVAALAQRGDPASLDYVVSALQDEKDSVKYEAAAAVIRLSRAGAHKGSGHRSREVHP